MADDLTVRFGGDTSALNASLAQARQALASFAPASTSQANASLLQLASSLARARQQTQGMSADLVQVAAGTYLIKEVGGAYISMAEAVGKAEIASVSFFARNTAAAAVWSARQSSAAETWAAQTFGISAAATALGNYLIPAANAERSERLFAQANSGVVASVRRAIESVEDYARALELSFTATARNELASIAAAGGLERFIAAANASGGIGAAKATLDDFTSSLMKIPGLSADAASSIESMFGGLPNYSTELNNILVNYLQQTTKSGDEALAKAKQIAAAFADTTNGGKTLGGIVGTEKNLEDLQYAAQKVAAALQPAQASAFYETINSRLRAEVELKRTIAEQDQAALRSTPMIGGFLAQIDERMRGTVRSAQDFAGAVAVATANLELQKRAVDGIVAAQARQVEFEKALGTETSRVGQLNDIEEKRKLLNDPKASQGRSNGDADVGSDRDLFIRTLVGEAGGEGAKGMEAVAAVIRNRVESAFDGMKSYKDVILEGNGKQFNTWSPGNAAGASVRNMSTDDPRYRQAASIVDGLGDLDDPTNGATSFYNPKTATNPFPMTNRTTIGNHDFGNTGGSPPVRNDDDDKARTQRLEELVDKTKELTDAQEGGSNADKASLEIQQQKARGLDTEVAAAQKLVDARQDDLSDAKGGSPDKERAAQEALASAEISLREKVGAVDKAQNELRTAQTEEGSKAQLNSRIAGYDAEIAAAAGNTAKITDLERQKYEARQAFARQQAADATEIENVSFDQTQRKFKEQQDAIRSEQQTKGLSAPDATAQIDASLKSQETATAAHYARLKAIQAQFNVETSAEDRKNAQQAALAQDKLDQERVANTRRANQQIEQSFKGSFESVGSTVASSVEAIIEHTGTMRQLLTNVARNILSQFVGAGVKMVADWLAHQAAMVAGTLLAQTQMTAASSAGEAARTGIAATGAAAAAATKTPAIVGSILASANETFAGIFGFLSPILGPLAAGPAAAGQAVVAGMAALPSFASGSWSLPSDMVANVHAGEMIVPAGPAALLRAAAGARGGGNSSTNTFGDINFNMHGHKSPDETMDHIRKNMKEFKRMLSLHPTMRS